MAGKAVLVLEDALAIRRLIVEMLAEIDEFTTFLQAGDAATAAQMIQREPPAVAVLDINVPSGDGLANGIEVLKLAKRINPQMLVIMLTNHDNQHYRHVCQEAGADYFFDKSTEFDLLPSTIRSSFRAGFASPGF